MRVLEHYCLDNVQFLHFGGLGAKPPRKCEGFYGYFTPEKYEIRSVYISDTYSLEWLSWTTLSNTCALRFQSSSETPKIEGGTSSVNGPDSFSTFVCP